MIHSFSERVDYLSILEKNSHIVNTGFPPRKDNFKNRIRVDSILKTNKILGQEVFKKFEPVIEDNKPVSKNIETPEMKDEV